MPVRAAAFMSPRERPAPLRGLRGCESDGASWTLVCQNSWYSGPPPQHPRRPRKGRAPGAEEGSDGGPKSRSAPLVSALVFLWLPVRESGRGAFTTALFAVAVSLPPTERF